MEWPYMIVTEDVNSTVRTEFCQVWYTLMYLDVYVSICIDYKKELNNNLS